MSRGLGSASLSKLLGAAVLAMLAVLLQKSSGSSFQFETHWLPPKQTLGANLPETEKERPTKCLSSFMMQYLDEFEAQIAKPRLQIQRL